MPDFRLPPEGECPLNKDGWPLYSIALRSGNRRLVWRDVDNKPHGIREFIPTEPKEGYATRAAAEAAFLRFMDALRERRDYTVTVKGFGELWADPYESPWHIDRPDGKRSEATLRTNGAKIAKFVAMYGDKRMIEIQRRPHVEDYITKHNPQMSALSALSLMWRDAASEEGGQIVTSNPFEKVAKSAEVKYRQKLSDDEIVAPTVEQAAALLDAVYSDPYPVDFARWLEWGMETGMRCGEIDAVSLEDLIYPADPNEPVLYHVRRQWNARLNAFSGLKHDRRGKGRKIPLSRRALEIVEECRPQCDEFGTEFLFLTSQAKHMSDGYRDRYWSHEDFDLRAIVDGMPMKNATRHFFATRQMARMNQRLQNGLPPVTTTKQLAEHMGHSEKILQRHYAKHYERPMQLGMHRLMDEADDELAAARARRKAA